jgi:hypothetical protein
VLTTTPPWMDEAYISKNHRFETSEQSAIQLDRLDEFLTRDSHLHLWSLLPPRSTAYGIAGVLTTAFPIASYVSDANESLHLALIN